MTERGLTAAQSERFYQRLAYSVELLVQKTKRKQIAETTRRVVDGGCVVIKPMHFFKTVDP